MKAIKTDVQGIGKVFDSFGIMLLSKKVRQLYNKLQISHYSNVDMLGLDKSQCTLMDIVNRLPKNSILTLEMTQGTFNQIDVKITPYARRESGFLQVARGDDKNKASITFSNDLVSGTSFFNKYVTENLSNWTFSASDGKILTLRSSDINYTFETFVDYNLTGQYSISSGDLKGIANSPYDGNENVIVDVKKSNYGTFICIETMSIVDYKKWVSKNGVDWTEVR
ncbi:TPA: hypothetical protein N2710_000879 [Vibrio parahaemolyticus]|nr:hypothetical protein [Vibrio parahaemolyticus]HCM0561031.1 hypothetical protein [Vibrio parahaemolyticus]